MRRLVFATLVLIGGCGRAPVATTPAPSVPRVDPIAARREDDAQAAYSLDSAGASVETALAEAKRLAPLAGGDAKEALLDVADMLDSVGATLADHSDPPPPLAEYRKADPSSERKKAVDDATDALEKLRDARDTLDDLSKNVPAEHRKALEGIEGEADEAVDAVESAIRRLGGKVPPEDDDQSNDRS